MPVERPATAEGAAFRDFVLDLRLLTVSEVRDLWDLEQDGTLTISDDATGDPLDEVTYASWLVCYFTPSWPDLCDVPVGGYDMTAHARETCIVGGTGPTTLYVACPTQVWRWQFTDDTLDDTDTYEATAGGLGSSLADGCFRAGSLTSGGLGLATPFPPLAVATTYTFTGDIRNDNAGTGPIYLTIHFYQAANGTGLISTHNIGPVSSGTGTVSQAIVAPANPAGGSTVYLHWTVRRLSPPSNELAACDVLVSA